MNWNTAASALRSADAHHRSDGVETTVTIADNGSLAAQRELLRAGAAERDWLALRLEHGNLGYGAAVNRALEGTAAELVCASNADLIPSAQMLSMLAEVALQEPRAGLVAPALGDGYHARLPAPWSLPLRAFWGGAGHRTVSVVGPAGAATVLDVEQPAGACLMARTEVWRELGGFDGRFLLWFEDVDLARRSLGAGYRNLVVAGARAEHAGAEAFALVDPTERQRIRLQSLARYTAKHHRRWRPATAAAIALARPLRTGELSAPEPEELAQRLTPRFDQPGRVELGE